jgi:hypothetical protein
MVLKFQFKGDRDYVHGTDMLNKFLDVYEDISNFSIRIKKITNRNLRILQEVSNEIIVATIVVEKKTGLNKTFFLVEADSNAEGRYPYNERELVSCSTIDDRQETITMTLKPSYTLIENIVALHKKLVTKLISSDLKWLFVGMEMKQIPNISKSDQATIKIEKKLGTKLIKSSVWINKNNIGSIRFSAIKKT